MYTLIFHLIVPVCLYKYPVNNKWSHLAINIYSSIPAIEVISQAELLYINCSIYVFVFICFFYLKSKRVVWMGLVIVTLTVEMRSVEYISGAQELHLIRTLFHYLKSGGLCVISNKLNVTDPLLLNFTIFVKFERCIFGAQRVLLQ